MNAAIYGVMSCSDYFINFSMDLCRMLMIGTIVMFSNTREPKGKMPLTVEVYVYNNGICIQMQPLD